MKLKLICSLTLLILFNACSTGKTTVAAPAKPTKPVSEGIVIKKHPAAIENFSFDESVNAFFHKSVSKNRRKTVTNTLKKGKRINENKDKYSRQIQLIESSKIDPLWFQYFKEEIHGRLQVSLRVSSKGFPDIIVIEQGISADVDLIACQYISNYRFIPAKGRRSGKDVSAWIRIANQF